MKILFTMIILTSCVFNFPYANSMQSPDPTEVTEKDYHSLRNKITQAFSHLADKDNRVFKVVDRWKSDFLTGEATREYNKLLVNVSGQIARHPLITYHGLATIMCHETGHHFAGAPLKPKYKSFWASSEGQSDYFVGTQCFGRIFTEKENLIWYTLNLNQFQKNILEICESAHTNLNRKINCIRSIYGGISAVNYFKRKYKKQIQPKLNTPDTTVVRKSKWKHNLPQCRLDTFLAAAVCEVSYTSQVSKNDVRSSYCNRKINEFGNRPLCWYKPN